MDHKKFGEKVVLLRGFLLQVLLIVLFSGVFHVLYGMEPEPQTQKDLVTMPIEELMGVGVSTVLGASRYEQRISDAPASISIITSEEIKRYGYRTMADVLNSVRGFFVTYDRNYNYLGAGGFLRQGGLQYQDASSPRRAQNEQQYI